MPRIFKSAKPVNFTIKELVRLGRNQHLLRRHFPLKVGAKLNYMGQVFTVCELFRYRDKDGVQVGCRGILESGYQFTLLLKNFDSIISYGDGTPHPKYNAVNQLYFSAKRDGRIATGFPDALVKLAAKILGLKTAKGFDDRKVVKAFAKKQVPDILHSKLACQVSNLWNYEVDIEKFSKWLKLNFQRLLTTRDVEWNVPQIREVNFYSLVHKEETKTPMWYSSKQTLEFAKLFANLPPIVFKLKDPDLNQTNSSKPTFLLNDSNLESNLNKEDLVKFYFNDFLKKVI